MKNLLNKIESFLSNKEQKRTEEFRATPFRYIFLESLTIPAVALGIKFAGGNTKTGVYILGASFFFIVYHTSNVLEAQKATLGKKFFALSVVFFMLIMAAIIVAI